jgi:two-component system, LytTR family, sensor kinase
MRATGLKWALFFGVWTLIGLSFARQFYVSSSSAGNPVAWRFALSHSLADWYSFALLSIPAIGLARRLPIGRANWFSRAGLHLMFSALFAAAWVALRVLVGQWQDSGSGEVIRSAAFQSLLGKTFHFNLLIYWVVVSVAHAFDYYRKSHEHELNALELQQHLTQAKLQALQMQLNPHFLFNTLHAISSLMHKDVEAADRMIARLSDLLRYALESTEAHEVPLRQELTFLERYLEIERTRFGPRLTVHTDIAPDTLDAQVPNLILQPLVENAIQHGIERQTKPGQIELRAYRREDSLLLEISDNGVGLDPASIKEGVGLSNTRARLRQLYGDTQRLSLDNRAEGGLIVSVTIPFHVEPNGAAQKHGRAGR